MRFPPSNLYVAPALAVAFLAAGCSSFDPAKVRREQTADFTARLERLAASEMAHPLTLDDCIRIAMANNYDVRKADLDRELYRIGKNVAFTAFLPNVAASAGYQSYARDPKITERRFGTAEVNIGLPIFMPSSWFLYAAARQGYAAGGIAAQYVRQGIVLETTSRYYDLLVQQDLVAALDSQAEAARAQADRARGLADEGLIAAWEGAAAQQQAEARAAEHDRARRQLAVLRGELLRTMGLSPLAPIRLAGAAPTPTPLSGTTEERVLRALEIHPQLALADRKSVV